MATRTSGRIATLLEKRESELLDEWLKEQLSSSTARGDLISEAELQQQSGEFLRRLRENAPKGNFSDSRAREWEPAREVLESISRSRAIKGFSPRETAHFVFSFKKPLFRMLREEIGDDAGALADEIWRATELLDGLAVFTTETYQRSREDVIQRQQQELLELSTPVVKLWEGVVAVPLIGTLDSARTQVVMENLLQRIVETGATIAIIDITGVPMVDTLVAQHLIKTVAAARLMGADCIISGIRPQIAQTIVHLGVVLENVVTKATLADAIAAALKQSGLAVTRVAPVSQIRAEERQMERIAILKMGCFLLVTIQVEMHDQLALRLQDDLTERIVKDGARGVLIDISSLEMVDSFIGRVLSNIAAMSRILDAETVVVGMQPAVAITLVELGLTLPGVRTALNVERGMELLQSATGATPWGANYPLHG